MRLAFPGTARPARLAPALATRGILAAALMAAASALWPTPARAAFGYRRSITVQPAQVVGGPLADFPVLVRIVGDANLRTVGNGGHVANANGYDIQFRASDGTTVLDHEIERYDGLNGDLWAWVRIPSLANGTLFYLYYGDSTVTCPLANPGSVWDSSYKVVHHLSGNALDSTTNHNDSLDSGTVDQSPAQIGRGRGVPASGILQSQYSQYNAQFTFSAWIRWNDTGTAFPRLFDKRANAGTGVIEKTLFIHTPAPHGVLRYRSNDGDWRASVATPVGAWAHVAVTHDESVPAAAPTFYLNGTALGYSLNIPATGTAPSSEPFSYGNNPALLSSLDGQIDEIRISNNLRSPGWVRTEYNNQVNPGAFYSMSPEMAAPAASANSCGAAGQAAKDGALTVPGPNTVLNKYAVLAANAARGATSLTVTYPGGANGLTALDLSAGDLLLVIQMQGASIDTSNTAQYGAVTAMNGAGLHEFVTVASVAGPLVSLACADGLVNSYTAAGRVQVIKVPQYSTLTVGAGRSVVAPAWPTAAPFYGGVVALRAENLSLQGTINVSGRGFQGGQSFVAGVFTNFGTTLYVSANSDLGGEKGEGIAGNQVVYDGLGGRYGRGAPANGGGGGDGHNSGGGGGGNGHNGIVWRGQGNPDTSGAGWAAAWNLDPSLSATTTSSGGGRGGYSFSDSNQNASTTPPGNAAWAADFRREVGGLGGRPLPNDAASRVFMGGGGGAAHVNNVTLGDGGNGGGIVIVLSRSISGGGNILANGAAGENSTSPGGDGAGGGGAGGLVVVRAAGTVSGVTLRANGGAGGNQPLPGSPTEAEGPGGGGGGGFVALSAATVTGVTRTANGGANGTTLSPALSEFLPNGATRGGAGTSNAAAAGVPGGCLSTTTVGSQCPSGTVPTGVTFVANGNLATLAGPGPGINPAAQFTSGVPNSGNNTCPAETSISTWSGTSAPCTFAVQQPFPGDAPSGVPAATNWLYGNGNNTGAPYKLWEQTVNGLTVGQTYAFWVYASSALTPGPTCACTSAPSVQFYKDASSIGYGMEVPIESTAVGDVWQRYQSTFTATAASATLAIYDTNLGSSGGDLGLAQIQLQQCAVPTAVELTSFSARGTDSAVELSWETGSELKNLGFHLYRSSAPEGPYTRITSSPIPGLGSSPEGARYNYRDTGMANGITYFYELEDIETTGRTKRHGPVSATPQPNLVTGARGDAEGPAASPSLLTYGDPAKVDLRVTERSSWGVVIELLTRGFYAQPSSDGTVRLSIPGFERLSEPGLPSLPVERTMIEALVGRKVTIDSVQAFDVVGFSSLRPEDAGRPELGVRGNTVRAELGPAPRRSRSAAYPERSARVVSVGFQGETKKAWIELAPLRWDRSTGRLLLARRLRVRVSLAGREPGEVAVDDARGRRYRARPSHLRRIVASRLATRGPGLYAVRFEEVSGSRGRSLPAAEIRLSRLGQPTAFRLEPDPTRFGPGSTLYFLGEGADANPYGTEAIYELELGTPGEILGAIDARPSGTEVDWYLEELRLEENRFYQAGLLEAPDLWLWDVLLAPASKSYPFTLSDVVSTEAASLTVRLQGTSDLPPSPDHHVRVHLNSTPVSDFSWDGKTPREVQVPIPPGLLQEGENHLTLENVGDTEAAYSMVMLDRFAIRYPRALRAASGLLEGSFTESGVAEVLGLGTRAHVVDVTDPTPRWLTGTSATTEGSVRFQVEAGRRYLAVADEAVSHPDVTTALRSVLKTRNHQADYVVIGPRDFLEAAEPLLSLRRSQALRVEAVSTEEIFSEFGFGEARPEAIRDFLAYAYHEWRKPSPRYVLLLGDGTYDFKDYLATGVANRVPPFVVKTSFLWTASDPAYAAVNGEDVLPDMAIGRLPAANADELRVMVEKLLAFESAEKRGPGEVVLVADNPDSAGDFERDAEEIAGILSPREPRKIYLARLGVEPARQAILDAFDSGASLVSYMGHGGIQLWAQEDIFDTSRVGALAPRSEQPLVLTLNCLNGYFHFPYFNALSEELLKAEGKGTIAAFSPSGLSLNEPAHVLHKALLREILSGRHRRLGDAVLAAQAAYADSGALPELLSIYHLFGDPAQRLR